MKYYSRKLIKPENLNARNTLFGGELLRWIDEEAGIYAITKLESKNVVTKYISEIDFVSTAQLGDVIEIGMQFKDIGRTSIHFSCEVQNILSKKTIIKIENIVFVRVDGSGNPEPHGKNRENLIFNS